MPVMRIVLYISCLCFMLIAIPSQGEIDVDTHHMEYVTHSEKGFMMLFHGDSKGAVAEFEQALAAEPEHYEIYHYLGMAYADGYFWKRLRRPTNAPWN